MRGDQRRIGQSRHIPEALLIEMGQVDHDPQAIACSHQILPGGGQSRAGIRRAGPGKWNAVAEDVGAAPDKPERAKTTAVKLLQVEQVCIDGVGAFHVQDDGE
jgi:hypothetical protein